MHAYASEDPLFRALNAKGQRETNGELGDFCVRCHAPLAVELGLTDDGLNLDELDPSVLGVNCVFCHSTVDVEGTHNNPLIVELTSTLFGGIEDPVRNGFHRSSYSSLLDRDQPESSSACGTCHDIVTPAGVHIERTFTEWQESVYGRDPTDGQGLSCSRCHMDGEDAPAAERPGSTFPERRRHAHTFPAVDIALSDFPDRDRQRMLVQAELDRVINPQLCVVHDAVALDSTITVDVENLASGHSFPSGAAADRRVWIELTGERDGQVVYRSGRVESDQAVDDVVDPSRWTIGDRHFDAAGDVTHSFWDVATVTTDLLPAPTAFRIEDPAYEDPHRIRMFTVEGLPLDRVRMQMHLRPFPLDVARDLVAEEGLSPAVVDAIPTFTLESASLEWTPDLQTDCVVP